MIHNNLAFFIEFEIYIFIIIMGMLCYIHGYTNLYFMCLETNNKQKIKMNKIFFCFITL